MALAAASALRSQLRRAPSRLGLFARAYRTEQLLDPEIDLKMLHPFGRRPLQNDVEGDPRVTMMTMEDQPGDELAVNWSLNDMKIAPIHDAFHNMDWKQYVRQTRSKRDASRAVVATQQNPSCELLQVDSADARYKAIRDYEFDDVYDQVCTELSYADAMFVADGAVGSSREADRRVRVVTDNADTAYAMSLMMHRVPASFPKTGPFQVRVVAHGDVLSDSGVSEGAFVAVKHVPESFETVVLVSGSTSPVLLQQQILHALAEQRAFPVPEVAVADQPPQDPATVADPEDPNDPMAHYERSMLRTLHLARNRDYASLLMRCDAYVDQAGASGLVFGAAAPTVSPSLYAAHAAVWTKSGLASLFGGVAAVVPAAAGGAKGKGKGKEGSALAPAEGDVVINSTMFRRLATPNAVAHPTRAVVVNSKASSAKAVKPEDVKGLLAEHLLLAKGSEAAEAAASELVERFKAHGVKVVEATEAEAVKAATA